MKYESCATDTMKRITFKLQAYKPKSTVADWVVFFYRGRGHILGALFCIAIAIWFRQNA